MRRDKKLYNKSNWAKLCNGTKFDKHCVTWRKEKSNMAKWLSDVPHL